MPYIDEHARRSGATRESTWAALIANLGGLGRAVPAALAGPWGLQPPRAKGDWSASPQAGDCLPGFVVERSRPPVELALRGRHRFSRYALVFELDETGGTGCTLRARSYGEFPGLKGRAYRALVIGSGGHRVMVRRMLRDIAERA